MPTVEALSSQNITQIGLVVIGALVLIGVLLSVLITAIVGRLIMLTIVVALGILVWQQRTHIEDEINKNKCNLSATFFGVHLDAPASVKQACRTHT
jgi:hypothetical protein